MPGVLSDAIGWCRPARQKEQIIRFLEAVQRRLVGSRCLPCRCLVAGSQAIRTDDVEPQLNLIFNAMALLAHQRCSRFPSLRWLRVDEGMLEKSGRHWFAVCLYSDGKNVAYEATPLYLNRQGASAKTKIAVGELSRSSSLIPG